MFSKQIDLAEIHVQQLEAEREKRSSEGYTRKKERKKRLPKKLEDSALSLLKKQLGDSKGSESMAHASQQQKLAPVDHGSPALLNPTINPSEDAKVLMDKLISKMVFTAKDGIQKTTFSVDSMGLGSTRFKGLKITLTEFSTAPKIFNIELSGDPRAVTLFETHSSDFKKAVNKGIYSFEIGRIDAKFSDDDDIEAIDPDEENQSHE